MIYHIVTEEKWGLIKTELVYSPGSLTVEGYIHCSFETQILKVANSFYKNQSNILLLCINEDAVNSEIKVEDLFNLNEKYPHIYGELPIAAIESILKLDSDSAGDFILPDLVSLSSLVVKQQEWT